jgi:hypothetical protein
MIIIIMIVITIITIIIIIITPSFLLVTNIASFTTFTVNCGYHYYQYSVMIAQLLLFPVAFGGGTVTRCSAVARRSHSGERSDSALSLSRAWPSNMVVSWCSCCSPYSHYLCSCLR